MKSSEFIKQYPQFKKLLNQLPEDAYFSFNDEHDSVNIGMRLEVTQTLTAEVAMDPNFECLPAQWYRKMHEELIQSEVAWATKRRLLREKPDNSKEQLMICPKAGKCEWQSFGCEGTPHKAQEICALSVGHCPECVPYIEPEKEKKPPTYALHLVGNNDIHNRCAGKPVYDSSCPFCREIQSLKDRAINHSKMWQLHPASKVIESGYFCNKNFHQVPNSPFFHICNRYFSDGNTGGIY